MRSMWKGAISFGLVMIPVKLYAATEQRDVTFRQVHREDGGRIKFRRFCSIDGEEVPFADVAKGYELPDGEMVVLTDDDLAELPLPTAHSIEVVNFTPAEQLDTILANRAYYTEPEPAGVRAYALLRDALERSGKVAIARVALRQRESLASLRTRDGVMVLETLLNNTYTDSLENIFINAQTQMLLLYSLDCMLGEKEIDVINCKFLANEADREKITKSREILIQHIGEPITIKELSRKVAINECYLKKGFKEMFGTTIFDFYQSQRMEHAKYLLYEKGLSVTEVSLLLGYSSISHFSTAFKKHTGLKPCELLLRA